MGWDRRWIVKGFTYVCILIVLRESKLVFNHNFVSYFSFGVYCEQKNQGKGQQCKDYKYRLCCAKKERKNPYGQWSKWSECEGNCGPNNGKKKRMRKCFVKRPNCMKTETGLFAFQEIPCTKPCEGNFIMNG